MASEISLSVLTSNDGQRNNDNIATKKQVLCGCVRHTLCRVSMTDTPAAPEYR